MQQEPVLMIACIAITKRQKAKSRTLTSSVRYFCLPNQETTKPTKLTFLIHIYCHF